MAAETMKRRDEIRRQSGPGPAGQQGVILIEILVSIIILAVGMLGLAGLQARAMNAEFESYQRSQAIILANDMAERIRMDRANMSTFKNISNAANGTGYLGTTGAGSYAPDCTSTTRSQVDLCAWSDLLNGASETKGGNNVGAMVGARGCIFYDATTELAGVADSGIFTVAVAWQGTQDTVAPSTHCGDNLYGSEAKRRVVAVKFRLAKLV